jgi:hypothetical protein
MRKIFQNFEKWREFRLIAKSIMAEQQMLRDLEVASEILLVRPDNPILCYNFNISASLN